MAKNFLDQWETWGCRLRKPHSRKEKWKKRSGGQGWRERDFHLRQLCFQEKEDDKIDQRKKVYPQKKKITLILYFSTVQINVEY